MLNKLNHNAMKTYKYTKAQIRTVINSMNDYDTIHESQNGLMKTSFYVENGVCQAITRKYDDASWQVEYEFDIEKILIGCTKNLAMQPTLSQHSLFTVMQCRNP